MNSIDDDAKLLGIDEKVWNDFSKPKVEQLEFTQITDQVDDKASFERHKEAMRKRWFEYYKRCKDQQKKFKLIDQYNFLAQSKQR